MPAGAPGHLAVGLSVRVGAQRRITPISDTFQVHPQASTKYVGTGGGGEGEGFKARVECL